MRTLSHDVLWQAFHCLGALGLHSLACSGRDLLTLSSCARLHFLLNPKGHHALTGSPKRLCPGGGSGRCAKAMKSARLALNQLAHLPDQAWDIEMDMCEDRSSLLACVLPWIALGDCATRPAAVKAASKLARKGDRRVIGAILDGLRKGGDAEASGEALRTLAGPGDTEVLARLRLLLGELAISARQAALLVLPSVAVRGDEGFVAVALAQAGDRNDRIRSAAVQALGSLACEGDQKALNLMIRCLQDESLCVRRAAVLSLQKTSGGLFTASAWEASDEFLQ